MVYVPKDVALLYMNPYCLLQCLAPDHGRLQCNCGDTGIYEWAFLPETPTSSVVLRDHNRDITFHPVYSSGTAALQGDVTFQKNNHYFWELKMMTHSYGTDIMVGVGTSKIAIADWRFHFFSPLGLGKESWGFSYHGTIQHDDVTTGYGGKFGIGGLVGVHLDMWHGTLEYFLNKKPLGVAFRGLRSQELHPIVCSTAAKSAMKLTCSVSEKPSLQLDALKVVLGNASLHRQFDSVPGLRSVFEKRFFWLLPKL